MKNRVLQIKNKIEEYLFAISALVINTKASCDIDASTITDTMNSIDSTKSAAEKFVGIFVMFISWTGSIVLVIGIYKFIMSIKDDRPEEKARGIEMIFVGLILILFKAVLQEIGLLTGRGFHQTLNNDPGRP